MASSNNHYCFHEKNLHNLKCRFTPIKVESCYHRGKEIALIAWEDELTPHVDFAEYVSRREILESTIQFCNRNHPNGIRIESLKESKNLFDTVSKYSKLKFTRKGFDKAGRGVIYIYEVKNA